MKLLKTFEIEKTIYPSVTLNFKRKNEKLSHLFDFSLTKQEKEKSCIYVFEDDNYYYFATTFLFFVDFYEDNVYYHDVKTAILFDLGEGFIFSIGEKSRLKYAFNKEDTAFRIKKIADETN